MILKYNVPEPSEICMSAERLQRFFDFIMGDDLDFYEGYTVNLTEEEQERFFRGNPEFMMDVRGGCDVERDMERDRMDLVKERIFKEIMRKISEYEDGR